MHQLPHVELCGLDEVALHTVPCGVREVSPPERTDAARCDLRADSETQKQTQTQTGEAENALGVTGGAGGGTAAAAGLGSGLQSHGTEGAAEGVRRRYCSTMW